jgi:large subunit ribosomal protein L9
MVKATERRAVLNEELGSVAEVLNGKTLTFAVKAGETGRLYGSVSDEDIVEAIAANFEIEVEKRQVETEPIRQLGTYKVPVHLTMDLIPEIEVIIHREGEAPGKEEAEPEAKKAETPAVETAPEVVEEAVEVVEEAEVEPEAPEVEEDAEAEA